jgi:hypothetical protein
VIESPIRGIDHDVSRKGFDVRMELDLAVGDVIRIGDHTVMVVELQDGEVTLKVVAYDEQDDLDLPPRPLTQPR